MVKYDAQDGKRTVFIGADQFVEPGKKTRLFVQRVTQTPVDHKFCQDTRTGQWLFDAKSGELQNLPTETRTDSFSPQSITSCFVAGGTSRRSMWRPGTSPAVLVVAVVLLPQVVVLIGPSPARRCPRSTPPARPPRVGPAPRRGHPPVYDGPAARPPALPRPGTGAVRPGGVAAPQRQGEEAIRPHHTRRRKKK